MVCNPTPIQLLAIEHEPELAIAFINFFLFDYREVKDASRVQAIDKVGFNGFPPPS